ncbi:MAG: hypothetical protein EXS02_03720 [Planctomycetes bacterium]|nr:hypothetical protein [Planctomycetota bacterium]
MNGEPSFCNYCGVRITIVHVHGHGQCSSCGTNVEPCCSGASPQDATTHELRPELAADPKLFLRVFQQLGGADASVSEAALVFAISQWLLLGLEEALTIVFAGVHTGRLMKAGPAYRLPVA